MNSIVGNGHDGGETTRKSKDDRNEMDEEKNDDDKNA